MQHKPAISALTVVLGLSLLFPAVAQEPPTITPKDVLSHLARTVDWYQHLMAIDEGSATVDNFLPRDNAREFAKRALQSSFDFARAQAAVLSTAADADNNSNTAATSSLQQSLNKASTRITHLEERLQNLDSRIAHASGSQRDALVDERTAIAADLALAKQIETAIKTMTSFSTPKSRGKQGLLEKISMLQAANPINEAPANKGQTQTARAPADVSTFHPETAGIVVLASEALSLNSARKRIDLARDETNQLLESVDTLRAPLRTSIRAIVAQSDTISNSEDTAVQPSEWLNTSKQISDISGRFKQLSAVLIPLGETALSLQSVRAALDEWRKELDGEFASTARYLAIRVGVLLGGVLFILLASAIWQRAIFRYVVEPRRRRQLLLIKRVVVGFLLAALLVLGFLSSLGSVATLLGFVTAGLALALQNVILSAVAYFFLIGRYGLRVGDRVTVQGVTGQVIEVGLIRLFLMELVGSGTELHPTGRLAVFANSVIFQPSAIMKQAPGMDYTWHAVTLTVEDSTDYQQTRTRLTQAVASVYEDYRLAIDQQHKTFEETTHVPASAPNPVSQAQFSEKGLEITIRYPVSLNEQPGHIDERMVDRVIAEADKEPKLKFIAGGSPKISQVI
jgi:small-conductance mechanosensitive channel